jgi:hypothetical protein
VWLAPWIAIIYVYNPFTLTEWASGHDIILLAYGVAPLWLGSVLEALSGKEYRPAQGVKLAAISLVFASAVNNLAAVLSYVALPTAVFIAGLLLFRRIGVMELVRRCVKIGGWVVSSNLWWVIPMAVYGSGGYQYAGSGTTLLSWPNFADPVHFLEFLRGMGFWGYYTSYKGLPNFVFGAEVLGDPAMVAGSVLASLALLGIVRWRVIDPWLCAVPPAMYVIGVGLARAGNGPLGWLNRDLFSEVPGLFLFRSTYDDFEGLVFVAVIMGGACVFCADRMPRWAEVAVAALLVGSVFVASRPLFDGSVGAGKADGSRVNVRIPDDYPALYHWTTGERNRGGLLVLPQQGYVKMSWGLTGTDPLPEYSAIPVVVGSPEASASDGAVFANIIEAGQYYGYPTLLRRLGIGFVLVRHDLDTAYYAGTLSPATIEQTLGAAHYRLLVRIGAFDVFRVPGASSGMIAAKFLYQAVGAQLSVAGRTLSPEYPLVGGRAEKLVGALPLPVLGEGGDVGLPSNVGGRVTGVSDSPGQWLGTVRNVRGRFWLIVPETFSSDWHLTVEGEGGSAARVLAHAEVNGFENAWEVSGQGTVRVQARFGWRPLLVVSGCASGTSMLGGVLWVWAWRRRHPEDVG